VSRRGGRDIEFHLAIKPPFCYGEGRDLTMDHIDAAILGVVQGLTEFLPISSSGHLVLFQHLLGFQEPDLLLDTALHFGTLLASTSVKTFARWWSMQAGSSGSPLLARRIPHPLDALSCGGSWWALFLRPLLA
jgi:hypothetical protein